MANEKLNKADDQLLTAIAAMAKEAAEQDASSYALNFAAAANQLAEARAWLHYRNQPHGGSLTIAD